MPVNHPKVLWPVISVLLGAMPLHAQPEVPTWSTQIREVIDQRSSDWEESELEVQLRVLGAVPEGVRRVQARVVTAADDTGKSLLPAAKENDWDDFNARGATGFNFDLKLKNPARVAKEIPEVTGEIDLFIPRRDPACIFTLPIPADLSKPLSHATLAANGIKLTMWMAKDYLALNKEEQELPADDVEDNSVVIKADDVEGRLVEVEFLGPDGRKINNEDDTREVSTTGYDFRRPLPAGVQLRISVATDLATFTIPFRLEKLPAP